MATVNIGSNVSTSWGPSDVLNIVNNHNVTGRWTFTPTNPQLNPAAGASGSFGPMAGNQNIGPFGVGGTVTIFNDSTSPAVLTFNQLPQAINTGALTVTGPFSVTAGAVNITPPNNNVTISPTGTGVVTINPATQGSINNVNIGQSFRAPGAFSGFGLNYLDSSGTPGNVTNSNPKGRVAIAAGASSIVVTNTLSTATSTVYAVINQASADATLTQIVRVSCAAGSFTIFGNANATANTVVDFVLVNS